MTLEDLKFALEMNYVLKNDIDDIISMSKKNGIITDEIDRELVKLGYEKIFENQYEDEDDNDYEEDEFGYIEKFPNKSKFYED